MNPVTIVITNNKTGELYKARSYPDDDKDNDGAIEFYNTPVYEIEITSGSKIIKWKAVRFMPYWNDPASPDLHYKSKGFINSGLHKLQKKVVDLYLPNYGTQNRYSPHRGAIRIRNNFLIHAGPKDLMDVGWGSAGCVEIIGDFGKFKQDIRDVAGISNTVEAGKAIESMVKHKKLYVEIEKDTPPSFRNHVVSP